MTHCGQKHHLCNDAAWHDTCYNVLQTTVNLSNCAGHVQISLLVEPSSASGSRGQLNHMVRLQWDAHIHQASMDLRTLCATNYMALFIIREQFSKRKNDLLLRILPERYL